MGNSRSLNAAQAWQQQQQLPSLLYDCCWCKQTVCKCHHCSACLVYCIRLCWRDDAVFAVADVTEEFAVAGVMTEGLVLLGAAGACC
jgi:hypothetical protein